MKNILVSALGKNERSAGTYILVLFVRKIICNLNGYIHLGMKHEEVQRTKIFVEFR